MSLPNLPYTLHLGDCLETLRSLPDNSVDSVVTDPPYGLSFMGKRWDYDVPSVEIWAECLRVLKPGGHLLAFAGTRTQHRMAVRIEDAGFEIRDMIAWVYGSGFPKSLDVSKAIDKAAGAEREVLGPRVRLGDKKAYSEDRSGTEVYGEYSGESFTTAPATDAAAQWQGWGTALKPALEPVTVARKPLIGTVAANVLAHGTGALNIDGCRVSYGSAADMLSARPGGATTSHAGRNGANAAGSAQNLSGRKSFDAKQSTAGRWPANLIHDDSPEVVALFPSEAGASAPVKGTEPTANGFSGPVKYSGMRERVAGAFRADAGSAARFFYCAKTSRKDRNEGLATGDQKAVSTNATMRQVEDADWSARNGNHHPTVKPTDLMAYLCRLVTPPGGVVLDPFMGSGSTGKAAMREGFRFIGCERDTDENGNSLGYMAIARARIEHEHLKVTAAVDAAAAMPAQVDMFEALA